MGVIEGSPARLPTPCPSSCRSSTSIPRVQPLKYPVSPPRSKTHVHMCIDLPTLLMPSASPFPPQKRPMQDTPDIERQEGVHMICRCRGFGPVSVAIRTSLMPSCQTVQRDFKSALQRMPSDAFPHFMCSKAGSKGVGQCRNQVRQRAKPSYLRMTTP